MKMVFTLFLIIILLNSRAQDVIITVSGFQYERPIELDTIKIENLSNGTNLSLSNLPIGTFDYPINLSKGTINSVVEVGKQDDQIILASNLPGLATINIYINCSQIIEVELFDMSGKELLQSEFQGKSGFNTFRVRTTTSSLIRVKTRKCQKVFKSIETNEKFAPEISNTMIRTKEAVGIFKPNYTGFVYTLGDSLKIIAIKNGYHSGFIVNIPKNLDQNKIYLSKPCEGTETVNDFDQNIYNTVQIGNQCWMKENLNTTHYSDGTPLVDGTGIPTIDVTTKYWFIYADDPSNAKVFGRLYSWAAVMNDESTSNTVPSGVHGVCPEGWHVPSKTEWDILVEELGGEQIAGGKLKETGYENWSYPNTGADNKSGFTSRGNGLQGYGSYGNLKNISSYWTCTLFLGSDCYYVHQEYNTIENRIYGYQGVPQMGMAIRCIKD